MIIWDLTALTVEVLARLPTGRTTENVEMRHLTRNIVYVSEPSADLAVPGRQKVA